MIFDTVARRRLASLLRPWLQGEPELELSLGFLNSRAIAKNLRFDASVFNELVHDRSGFLFEDVTVKELIVRFSSWSVPAISFEVNGFNVALSVSEESESRPARKQRDTFAECLKKKLSQIDPEGSFFHNIIEKISALTPSGNTFKTAFSSLILKHCRLHIRNFNVELQFRMLNDSCMCMLRLQELNAESEYLDFGCLFRGLVGSFLLPVKQTSHVISVNSFEIVLKSVNERVLLSADLLSAIRLNDLQLIGFDLRVPELNVSLSPADLCICSALGKISSKGYQCTRNGRQLWKLAASRMGHVISSPRLKFRDVVVLVVLWLRYVKAYEYLLRLIGYSSDHDILKRSISEISQSKLGLRSVKQHWKLISDSEQELPAESIAQARRIARCRAALNAEPVAFKECRHNTYVKFIHKIFPLLGLIGKLIYMLFHLIVCLLTFRWKLAQEPNCEELEIASDDPSPGFVFILNLGRILVYFSLTNEIQISEIEKLESQIGIPFSGFVSVSLAIEELLLKFVEYICEDSLIVSCGKFMVESSSLMETPLVQGSAKEILSYTKGHRRKEMKSFLWCEQAPSIPLSESTRASTAKNSEVNCEPYLEKILAEMWWNWKRTCSRLEKSELQYSENPCLLCETRTFAMYPGLNKSDSGLWKCFSTIGKLHLDLSSSSIVSISVLLRQIQDSLCAVGDTVNPEFLLHSPRIVEDPFESNWDTKYMFYANTLSWKLLEMLPVKHIQLGVFMAGACINLFLEKEFSGSNNGINQVAIPDGFHLGFDIKNIELAVWPTSMSLLSSDVDADCDKAEKECTRLKQPQIIEIPKSENGNYISDWWIFLGSYFRIKGLYAYLGDSTEEQKYQIFVLQPLTIEISSSREYFCSFSTNIISLSTVLSASATGLTLVSYMDELYVLSQMVANLCSAISYVFGSFDSGTETFRQKFARTVSEIEEETGEELASISSKTLFLIEGILKIQSVDLTLQKTRMKDEIGRSPRTSDVSSSKIFAEVDLPDCGILISIHQTSIDLSCEEEKLKILAEFSDIQYVIFGNQNKKGKDVDQSISGDLLLHSRDYLYEISLSYSRCSLLLCLPQNTSSSRSMHNKLEDSSSGNNMSSRSPDNQLGGSASLRNTTVLHNSADSEISSSQNSNVVQKLRFVSNTPAPDPTQSLLVDIKLGLIYMGSCTLKNALIGAHELNNLRSSLSIGGEFQIISLGIQGGLLFLETKAMEKFICCFSPYLQFSTEILFGKRPLDKDIEKTEHTVMTRLDNHNVAEGTFDIPLLDKRKHIQGLTIDVSQLTTVLVIENEKGAVMELVLEIDVHLNSELANMTRSVSFDLRRLSFLSQVLQKTGGNELQIPRFYSLTLNNMSTRFESGEGTSELKHGDALHPPNDPSSLRDSDSLEKFSAKNCVPEILEVRHQKHILEHLRTLVSIEKHIDCQAWVGSGSISGLDIIISLYEIEMILCIISCFSGVFSTLKTSDLNKQRRSSNREESGGSIEEMVPDGSIVAIQDTHQHMYFTVDGEENKYSLAGAVHYSLVGERALFRVKYHRQRRWSSSILWFSLISLHAKNISGEPFRLNYRPGSGFVDISSTDDGSWARWRIHSCDPESHGSDDDWEPYNKLVTKNFYLVNKKNDCAVSFVDGVPEFVRKPGNPIKFKVFHDLSVARGFGNIDSHPLEDTETSLQQNETMFDRKISGHSRKFPCIDIVFDNKVSLTIVHELSYSSDMFPLLRACIDTTQLTVQVLSTKTRVISTTKAAIYHFDSRRNSWKELLHPVDIFLFYRSNFCNKDSAADLHGIPVHFHCRTKEVKVSLSELSLDLLLFVIGKLNLSGPYSVKSSRILVNCCKVENQTGINLLCQFNKQRVKIARNQSTSIFLRYSDLANQSPDSSSVSFQLAVLGSFTTSSIHLSLLQAQRVAWKTRIISSQGSKTYPGPFAIVDISRESEDGLAISVSPLIRIHNETRFSMELRFRRPQQKEDEFASVVLNSGDTIDDSMAMFDALHLSGGMKKALTSLSLGNFLFSFRPKITEGLMNSQSSLSVEWSDDLKGGKAVRLSGVFDKLTYTFRKTLLNEAVKCSFSTVQCSLKSEGSHIGGIHFLIQIIGRDVPIVQPSNSKVGFEYSSSPVTLQEQKEIVLLPTVKVSNFLQSEIHVILSETEACSNICSDNTLNQAMIPSSSSVDFYVNPSVIYFTVTLAAYNSSCKPVNSSDWVKKLQKQKNDAQYLDIDLDFCGGRYFACLRLARGQKGILEATIFTSYVLKNDTDFSLYFFGPNRKPLPRHEMEKFDSSVPPELGLLVPPKSIKSWFLKSNKVRLKLLEDTMSEAPLDLDALSGLTEISLEIEESTGINSITKLGISTGPLLGNAVVPSQLVTMVPRYVVVNESEVAMSVRQCYLQDDTTSIISIESRQRTTLQLWNVMSKRREFSFFENFIRNHRKANDDALFHIQFRPNQPDLDWSGPVCIASLGTFFLKFRKHQLDQVTSPETMPTFAVVQVVEEGSTLVLHYHKPPNVSLPYRIENCLRDVSITYFQKESSEQEVLGSESSVDYVWDDLTLPRRLVVRINDSHAVREINLDKVRGWKPFYKLGQQLSFHFLMDNKSDKKPPNVGEINSKEMVKVGYEVYADGPTRVLRICEIAEIHKGETVFQWCQKIQLRVPQLTLLLLEQGKQDGNEKESSLYTPIIAARFGHFGLSSLFIDQHKYNNFNLQSLNIEPKWVGAPFAALLRRHQVENPESNDCILRIVFVLLSTSSDVVQVKYSSIALQPIDLNLDEETLMKVVPFWRTSLADPNSKSRQFYFDHFEIHPVKMITNFLPGESYSSYSSAQETLRSLLHSVIKVPPIKNMVVELNGVLITHALITMRELSIRCAQHYSWYAMRAIYIAKGSPLLPPDFVSMFDDLASSSLDVFFDPSRALMNLPGFTLGTFKFISKCIRGKGSSGTKRYFGDLGKSLQTAGSNVLFAAVTEISDSVLKGAEASGFNGMVIGFHQGILRLAMEPSLLSSALMEGGPDRKIKLDRSPGVDELYIEGYLQAMLDTLYRQEYLRVRIIDDQVYLKNLPPNNALIEEITDHVKGFLVSKALLKGDPSRTSQPLRHLRGESEWRLGPTLLTLCEHLFVSFAIRMLRKQANKFVANIKLKKDTDGDNQNAIVPSSASSPEEAQKFMFIWRWGITRFVLSGIVAYVDGRLCRSIPNPIARRIVSGFLLSFLDNKGIDE